MKMALGGTIAVALIFICSVRAVMAQPPAYAPAPGPDASSSTPLYDYYIVQPDEDALKSILESWTKTNTKLNSLLPGWSLEDVRPCITGVWLGVFCSVNSTNSTVNEEGQNVTRIALSILGITIGNTDLAGDLPPAFGNLSGINFIYITGNSKLTGPIPKELGQLPNLEALDLHGNNFTGSIPPELGNIMYLTELDLSGNQLTGNIPGNLGNASYLFTLKLSQNFLNGSIPATFSSAGDGPGLSNLQNLMSLDLSNNLLNGTVNFSSFSGMNALSYETLNLSHNFFDNMIPLSSGFLNYTTIDLSNNQFNNFTISSNFLPPLQLLYVRNNSLRGEFPSSVLECQSLHNVYFDYNQITSLSFPVVPLQGFVMSTISLVGNDISTVNYAKSGPFSESLIGSQNVLFLGGNPYCTKIESNLKASVCRFSKSSPPLSFSKQSTNILEIVLSTVAGFLFLVIMTFAVIIQRLYIKNLSYRKLEQELSKQEVKPKMYSYSELRVATREFHHDNKLGEGGFGVVYKGTLSDNTHVAVKQLMKSKLVLSDFLNEVVIISGIRHRNLIKLKGCCLSGHQRILVYEYAENKNLAQALWDCPSENKLELDWSTRLRIIIGIARALTYLHEEVQPPIIHRDIKAPNILLDKDLNPKVADFGLALLVPELDNEQTHITRTVIGTRGYLSPEYASFGHISTSIDTFSFGIVILEIISGRKNIDFGKPEGQHILLQWAWSMHETNELWHLIDPKLAHETLNTEITQVIKIGLSCVQYMPANRPKMSDIVTMLLDRKQVENVHIISESASEKFGSFNSNFTSSSYVGQEGNNSIPGFAAAGKIVEGDGQG